MDAFVNMYILYKCENRWEFACVCVCQQPVQTVRDKQAELDINTAIIKAAELCYGGMFAHLQQYLSRSPYLP